MIIYQTTKQGKPLNNKPMKTGTVKFFNAMRGFGFIKVNGTDEEVFVHKTDVNGTIRENDEVEFEIKKGEKGQNAVDVKVIR
jgi:cold shock protein